MVKIIMHGCNGHMGQVISGLVEKDPDAEIVAGIDVADQGKNSYPVYTNMEECQVEADALIDFSSAKATDALLAYCEKRKLPVVLCTTGLSEEQLAKVEETSKNVAVLKSANMSLGINTLMKLLQDAAKVLATAGFDMEIVEKHHRLKLDAPSGTALALADSINEAMDNQYHYIYDRSQRREMRDDKEIGISAVRGGTIVGEHEVIFAGPDEATYTVKVHVDADGDMVIVQNPTLAPAIEKSDYEPKTPEANASVDADTVNDATAFLETFFKLYPTATEKELAYYVSGNVLEPIGRDYIYAELVNPIFTKDGDNVKVKVAVKFLDNQTKATQISQYELVLHKDSNWKIVG